MNDHRYMDDAHAFDESLVEILSEAARESAVKEAEAESARKDKAGGGLQRIAEGRTPLDEVKAILEKQQGKTAAQEIREYEVRRELRKVASRPKDIVDGFLENAKGV